MNSYHRHGDRVLERERNTFVLPSGIVWRWWLCSTHQVQLPRYSLFRPLPAGREQATFSHHQS